MTHTDRALDEVRPLLVEGVDRLGLDSSNEVIAPLLVYLSELLIWNRRYNLVKATPKDLIIRHVLDSLAAVGPLRREWRASVS